MLRWVYSVACFLALLGASPWIVFQMLIRKKYRARVAERLGSVPLDCSRGAGGPCLWIHGSSVGEVLAGKPIIDALIKRHPDLRIVLSVVTDTGYDVARERIPHLAGIFQAPVDFTLAVKRVMQRIHPDGVVILETELWPNFIWTVSSKVPVVLVNGRISDRSYPGYMRAKFLFGDVLRHFTALGVQSEADARRFIDLGVPEGRVHVLGNVKFDISPGSGDGDFTAFLNAAGWGDDSRILTAGSTHHGEEALIIDVYLELLEKFSDLKLILAPRHIERAPEVAALLEQRGCRFIRRSEGVQRIGSPVDIILLDTLGELTQAYAAAVAAFVGGSLVDIGGHNVLEPAVEGKPVVFGPHMQNFREASQLLLDADAAVQISDPKMLKPALETLLSDPESARAMGERARDVVSANAGAVDRYVSLIETCILSPEKQMHSREVRDGG